MTSKARYRPSDFLEGNQAFSITVTKTDEGKFSASSPNRPEIPPVVDSDRRSAIQGMTQKLNELVQGGFDDLESE